MAEKYINNKDNVLIHCLNKSLENLKCIVNLLINSNNFTCPKARSVLYNCTPTYKMVDWQKVYYHYHFFYSSVGCGYITVMNIEVILL